VASSTSQYKEEQGCRDSPSIKAIMIDN